MQELAALIGARSGDGSPRWRSHPPPASLDTGPYVCPPQAGPRPGSPHWRSQQAVHTLRGGWRVGRANLATTAALLLSAPILHVFTKKPHAGCRKFTRTSCVCGSGCTSLRSGQEEPTALPSPCHFWQILCWSRNQPATMGPGEHTSLLGMELWESLLPCRPGWP